MKIFKPISPLTKTSLELTFTLISDGSSDRALLPVLEWLLSKKIFGSVRGQWADFSHLRRPPSSLRERIATGVDLWPADLIFVHRDAEHYPFEQRRREVLSVISVSTAPAVCVVPVRMMEVWLLSDAAAIRFAAGNPSGKMPLPLPAARRLERLPNPKANLHELLREASGLNNRRRRHLEVYAMVHDVARATADFSPLFELEAFRQLDADLEHIVFEKAWNAPAGR